MPILFGTMITRAAKGLESFDSNGARVKTLKILLSVFLIYHLFTVLLLPVGSSLPGRKLARYVLPYANTLGFNSTWEFFSPGPSPGFYLQYIPDRRGENPSDESSSEPRLYPPKRSGLHLSDGWNRRLYAMRFLATQPERLEKYLVPFLCRGLKGAAGIDVRSILDRVEDIERAGTWTDFNELAERIDLPKQTFACPVSGEAG